MGSSERSNPRHYDPSGPLGLLRRKGDGTGPTKWWPVAVLVGILVVSSGWLITRSPVFAARRVVVTGDTHFSRAQVLRLAGVGPGTNLFWFHAAAVEKRLLRSPWIAAADVSRSLPSTLRVAIRERRAVAQVRLRPHRLIVVAADGTVLAHATHSRDLPWLTFDRTTVPVGRRVAPSAWVVGAMSPWVRSRVHSVAATAGGSIVVHLASGVPVYFGDASQVRQKDQSLAAVLHWAIVGGHPLDSINVQAPLVPTATLHVYTPPVTVSVAPTPSPSPSGSPSPSPTPSTKPSPAPSPRASPSKTTKLKTAAGHAKRHR